MEKRLYALVVEVELAGTAPAGTTFPEATDVGPALVRGLESWLRPGLWVGEARCVELDEATPYDVAAAQIDPGLASAGGSR
jgi:hypothetical protein